MIDNLDFFPETFYSATTIIKFEKLFWKQCLLRNFKGVKGFHK